MQCAEVVGIIKRGWHPIAATLQPDVISPLWVVAVPIDTRWPKLRLQTQQEQLLKGKTLVVAFDAWEATSRYPTGHYVRTLGETGDKNVEAEALCIDHEVDTRAFSQKVLNCLPPKTWMARVLPPRIFCSHLIMSSISPVPESDYAPGSGREDFRALNVMSVDPPGCKDIDDALHVRKLLNGNWEFGVHIADVTSFVEYGSAIDLEARARGTTVYLVQRRIDM
jgi:exosome complex exonuclease DIS3/RRP44